MHWNKKNINTHLFSALPLNELWRDWYDELSTMKTWDYTYSKPGMSLDEPPIAESRHHNIAVHWPSKVWPVDWLLDIHARRSKGILKNHYTSEGFIQNKYNILVFYFNRNLNIAKSKKMKQDKREEFYYFILLINNDFAAILKSHRSGTWRHTSMRTESPISLETPPPSWVNR